MSNSHEGGEEVRAGEGKEVGTTSECLSTTVAGNEVQLELQLETICNKLAAANCGEFSLENATRIAFPHGDTFCQSCLVAFHAKQRYR